MELLNGGSLSISKLIEESTRLRVLSIKYSIVLSNRLLKKLRKFYTGFLRAKDVDKFINI